MKKRFFTATTAAFLVFCALGVTVYAAPLDTTPPADTSAPTENAVPPTMEPVMEHTVEPTVEPPVTEDAASNPFTPSGAGTVTNYATDADGKEFYTITAPDKQVFYLVIDRQRGQENVYFLNAVTVDDLLPLAQQPETASEAGNNTVTPPTGTVTSPSPVPVVSPAPIPEVSPQPDQPQGGGNTGILIVVVIVAFGGGAIWFFKFRRPKRHSGSESDFASGDAEPDDWAEPDDDGEGTGEAPPWDEDNEQ